MTNYFASVKTLDELKAQYRRLAMKHHPDVGGDVEIMKEINRQHDALFETLKAAHNAKAKADTTGRTYATTETAEEFRAIIEALLKLDGLTVELCGSWLWIGGNTRENKDALKAAGCRWSSSKSCGIGGTRKTHAAIIAARKASARFAPSMAVRFSTQAARQAAMSALGRRRKPSPAKNL